MIQLVEHKNINKTKWDACINKAYNQSVSSYSWFLDIVCSDWAALILNDYEAVFPLPIKSKYKIKYLLQPLFVRSIGIYSGKPITEKQANDFFDAIPKEVKLVDLYIKENTPLTHKAFKTTKRKSQILDLNRPYEIIQKTYSSSVAKNLKKAEKHELRLIENVLPKTIAQQYKENIGHQANKLGNKEFKTIETIINTAAEQGQVITLGVINNRQETIASAAFTFSPSTLFFSFGSANTEGKSNGAMYLMVDAVIKKHAQQLKYLDFEGSDMEGIATFNRNFGALDNVYSNVKKNTLPEIIKWLSNKK